MSNLKIWWIPNPPRELFEVEVKDIDEAILILNTLADYDLYLGDDLISCNAGGLQEFVEGEWIKYESPQGYTIDDFLSQPELLEELKKNNEPLYYEEN